uniref:Uncharacterized protein n=1 Tax=Sphaerodactylus townsendi TaxID=933632 RepID=A0ACB8G232_9SAUR
MKKSQGLNNLSRATEDAVGRGRGEGRAPPSPAIPPKRAKVAAEQGDPSAPVFLQELKDTGVSIGHNILLRVVVAGDPQPHLSWYKEKVPIPPTTEGEEKEEEEYGSFWIRNTEVSDGGVYSCIAKNEHGEAVTSATVTVTDEGFRVQDSQEDSIPGTVILYLLQVLDD